MSREWSCETCTQSEFIGSAEEGLCYGVQKEDSRLKTLDGKPLRVKLNGYCNEHELKYDPNDFKED